MSLINSSDSKNVNELEFTTKESNGRKVIITDIKTQFVALGGLLLARCL